MLTWHVVVVVVVVVVVQKCSSSSVSTRVQDECGVGTAYTLVNAVLDQVDDNVSASALDALGKLTLDACYCMDKLSAARRIEECANCGITSSCMKKNRNNNIHRRIIELQWKTCHSRYI